ncbi:MAG: cytochrome c biogenesis protein CcsA, partial [Sphingobacterium sp.]
MKKIWWKILAVLMVAISIVAGLLGPVPELPILNETIRNVYFHVPMWFTMVFLYLISVIYSIKYLSTTNRNFDIMAVEAVNTGILFCVCGLLTGMLWANITWGDPWPNDPKLNGSAIATLMYLAYLVLRNSLEEEQKRAKISAIYNIFAFPIMLVLLY